MRANETAVEGARNVTLFILGYSDYIEEYRWIWPTYFWVFSAFIKIVQCRLDRAQSAVGGSFGGSEETPPAIDGEAVAGRGQGTADGSDNSDAVGRPRAIPSY